MPADFTLIVIIIVLYGWVQDICTDSFKPVQVTLLLNKINLLL